MTATLTQRPDRQRNALRRQRAKQRFVAAVPPLAERLRNYLLTRATKEILRRGGEISIQTDRDRERGLSIIDRSVASRLTLVGVEGWRYYGPRGPHRYARLRYLHGVDDTGPWAVRVPGTIQTVEGALRFLTPADVVSAQAAGRAVVRQGDVYAIATSPRYDGTGELPEGHRFNSTTRYLTHHPADGRRHRAVRLGYPVRFVVQSTYEMGRTAGRARGD